MLMNIRLLDCGWQWPMLCAALLSVVSAVALGGAPGDVSPPAGLDMTRVETLRLEHVPSEATAFDLSLVLGGDAFVVRLQPHSLRASDFQVWAQQPDGTLKPEESPPVRTRRGVVLGEPGSVVAATVADDGLTATIRRGDGAVWHIQPANAIGVKPVISADNGATSAARGGAAARAHIAYRAADVALDPALAGCGAGALASAHARLRDFRDDTAKPAATAADRAGDGGCLRIAQLALDADHEFYLLNGGSVPQTVADIELVLNEVDLLYARDLSIAYEITAIVVRSDEADPYTASRSEELLLEFQAHWQAERGAITRDMAHLFTGRDIDLDVIGIAYIGAICADNSYGLSQSRFVDTLPLRAALTAHELGHNWNAIHCDENPQCAVMCAGIGQCPAGYQQFEDESRGYIRAYRDGPARDCLDAAPGYPTPLPPRAFVDEAPLLAGAAARIDVLANDEDGNCDALSIGAFDAVTQAGALISLSRGTGPAGRDELFYQPVPGAYVDSFRYAALAPDGASEALVAVSVLAQRAPQVVTPAISGLRGEFFDMRPTRLPDLDRLTPVRSDVAARIFYPPTSGVFATSFRAERVAARFTGMIDLRQTEAGLYTFITESDEGSRLYVDDALVVDNDGLHEMRARSGTITLSAGLHRIRVDYYDNLGEAGLIVSWEGPGIPREVIPAERWIDLRVDYFDLPILLGVPSLAGRVADHVERVTQVDFPLAEAPFGDISGLREEFAARFDGFLLVETPGIYRLHCAADSGANLYLGSTRLIDNDGIHFFRERSAWAGFQAGLHPLRVEYVNGRAEAGLIVSWEGPGIAKQPIPPANWRSRPPRGDPNCDGIIDFDDVDAFVAALASAEAYARLYPSCDAMLADIDGSGQIDFDDIEPFVACLVSGVCAEPTMP